MARIPVFNKPNKGKEECIPSSLSTAFMPHTPTYKQQIQNHQENKINNHSSINNNNSKTPLTATTTNNNDDVANIAQLVVKKILEKREINLLHFIQLS